MTPEAMTEKLEHLEKCVLRSRRDDVKTKYQVISLFREMRKLIKCQVPTPPINVSEDRHKFECRTCGTKFDSEDTVDEFNLCYICGQRWKEQQNEVGEQNEYD